jgi:predicted acylesterase/phospholipase RssA
MTRLALVLSGGVSLGTYVAGAVLEILRAIEQDEGRGLRLDVVAGSSAGALTAALAGRAMSVNPQLIPWLEKVWVDVLDADLLLNSGRPDRSGFMDVSAVDELSRALITAGPASDDRPSPACGDPLHIGLALSNLEGIAYDFRYGFLNPPERFYGSRVHRDWIEFELGPQRTATDGVWEELRDAALASAAFPFAFPPRPIERRVTDYPGARFPDGASPTVSMSYTDGGLFDNEPVRLARHLARKVEDHRSADWRYVLVDPYMGADREGLATGVAESTSHSRLAGQLAHALLGQASVRDWLEANKANARLEILESLINRLPDLGEGLRDPAAVDLGRSIGELAEQVAEMKIAVSREPLPKTGDPVLDYLDRNLDRIQADRRFDSVLGRLETRAARTRMAKLIFVLESAAGLRDKSVLPLYLVAPPEPKQLHGDFLANFGGFFSREWRANDFRAGRRDARRLLEEQLGDVVSYRPASDDAYRVEMLDASFDAMPGQARKSLERFVQAEAGRVVGGLKPGFLASLFGWAWKPVVRRWAGRQIMDGLRSVR